MPRVKKIIVSRKKDRVTMVIQALNCRSDLFFTKRLRAYGILKHKKRLVLKGVIHYTFEYRAINIDRFKCFGKIIIQEINVGEVTSANEYIRRCMLTDIELYVKKNKHKLKRYESDISELKEFIS